MIEKIKILVVDDHTIVRQGICEALQKQEDFEVVGEADCGHTAITLISECCPDVVIMDINMPGLNGIETTKHIMETNPNIKVIALSMHSEKIYVKGMLDSGASGYLLKTCSFKELSQALNIVCAGETYLCPEITNSFVNDSLDPTDKQKNITLSMLTPRERDVLQFIAEGYQT
ncbi:response regulator transcription factor, partial [bacterium]|nr:response regulator transcription factor [bacterium]